MSELDLLEVYVEHEAEVAADEAFVNVTVQGSSLVVGNAVFDKAKEVAQLVNALARVGIPRDDIELRDVNAEVTSGLLGRSSSATYALKIRCRDLDKLPDALGEISSAKQAALNGIEWHFPDDAAHKAEWLARCVADAGLKAQAMANALSVRIAGVHRVVETRPAHATPHARGLLEGSPLPGAARSRVALGFAMGQRQLVHVAVSVSYRLAPA